MQAGTAPVLEHRENAAGSEPGPESLTEESETLRRTRETNAAMASQQRAAEEGRSGPQAPTKPAGQRNPTESGTEQTAISSGPLTGLPAEEHPPAPETGLNLEYRETQPEAEERPVRAGDTRGQQTPPMPKASEFIPQETGIPHEETPLTEAVPEIRNAIPETSSPMVSPWKKQISLTYAQPAKEVRQQPVQAAPPETPSSQNDPPGFQNLPAWAQDMLRRTGGISNDQFTAPNSIQFDAGRNGSNGSGTPPFSGGRQQPPIGTGRQITWTAPGAIPTSASVPQAGSPPMVFRERENSQENQSLQNRTMDEREIRKTADKVYRLIEERLRKELRRGGK